MPRFVVLRSGIQFHVQKRRQNEREKRLIITDKRQTISRERTGQRQGKNKTTNSDGFDL